MEVILFGDIEPAIITYLKAQFTARSDTVAVGNSDEYGITSTTRPPANRIVVTASGGNRRDIVVDSPTVEFESYAPTRAEAKRRAQLVRGLVNALPGTTISGIPVYRVQDYASPAILPHPLSGNPRCVYTARIDFRGSAE